MAAVAVYFLLSIAFQVLFSIDIMIPCLWKTLLGIECPGCGMTRAFIDILTLDFRGALLSNPLIFVVLPLGGFHLVVDFQKHRKQAAGATRQPA